MPLVYCFDEVCHAGRIDDDDDEDVFIRLSGLRGSDSLPYQWP